MRVDFSVDAEADLREIADFIAADNPRRAATFLKELRRACLGLCEMPLRFPLASPERDANIRKRPYAEYVILYEVGENAVSIARVLHSARDYGKVLIAKN